MNSSRDLPSSAELSPTSWGMGERAVRRAPRHTRATHRGPRSLGGPRPPVLGATGTAFFPRPSASPPRRSIPFPAIASRSPPSPPTLDRSASDTPEPPSVGQRLPGPECGVVDAPLGIPGNLDDRPRLGLLQGLKHHPTVVRPIPVERPHTIASPGDRANMVRGRPRFRVSLPLKVHLDPDQLLPSDIRGDHYDQMLALPRLRLPVAEEAILPRARGLEPGAVGSDHEIRALRELHRRCQVVEAMPQGRVVGRGGGEDHSEGREPSDKALQAPIVAELLPDDEQANERVRETILAAALATVHRSEFLVPVFEGGRVQEELPSDDKLLVVRRPIRRSGWGLPQRRDIPGTRRAPGTGSPPAG